MARTGAGAAFDQLRHHPREWHGVSGYARRFGANFGQHVVRNTIQLGVGAWRHEDPRYFRSNRMGFLPRARYAIASTFVARRTNRSGRTVAIGRLSGNMGAGVISRLWQPAGTAGLATGIESGGISIGADMAMNLFREFWPDIHNRLARARK